MIELTTLSGKQFWLNPHLIESIERNPDTTILLSDGKRLIVKEGVDEILWRIVEYRRSIGISIAED